MKRATRTGWADPHRRGRRESVPASTCRADAETFSKHVGRRPGRPCGGGRPRHAPRRRQRGGRGGRDGVRPGGDAPRGGQPGRRRLHRRLPGRTASEVVTVDFREMAPRSASADDVPRPRRQAAAPVPDRRLGGRRAGDRPRPGPGPRAVGETPLGRAGPAGRPPGARRLPHLRRPRRVAQSPARPRRTRTSRADDAARTTSAGWATSPSRSPRSASPTAPPGRPATGSSRPTWPRRSTGSPSAGPTSSTPAGPPS